MAFSLRKRVRESAVPIDSFSDIAFLLIIFFILTTSIRRLQGFTTELPAGEESSANTMERTPTVAIRGADLSFEDRPVSLEELKERLQGLNLAESREAERVVLLDATEDVAYQDYFEVMSMITAAGGVVGLLSDEEGQ